MNIDHLKREKRLRAASAAYYDGAPTMTDAEFDALSQVHARHRGDPGFPAKTILDQVGAPPSGAMKVNHPSPMLSLANLFEDANGVVGGLDEWLAGIDGMIIAEPKVDGLSLNCIYDREGALVSAVTRGDGDVGEDVTETALSVGLVQTQLPSEIVRHDADFYEYRGEVHMCFDDFARINERRASDNQQLMANPRNAAAGAVRKRVSVPTTEQEALRFVLHDTRAGGEPLHYTEGSCSVPIEQRLQVVVVKHDSGGIIPGWFEDAKRMLESLPFPTDGIVLKAVRPEVRELLGATSRTPRWACAIKLHVGAVRTKINSITVQVGRQGTLTPVAELEPVEIDGTIVSRATLHNEDFVRGLRAAPGATVEVKKAGMIIPEVVRVIEGHGPEDWSLVDHVEGACPSCASTDLKKDDDGAAWRCTYSPKCPAQLAARVDHFGSRDALDIAGMGGELAVGVAERYIRTSVKPIELWLLEMLENPPTFYQDLPFGERNTFGESRAKKLAASCGKAMTAPLHRQLAAMGIKTVGVNTSKEVARLCYDAGHLRTALLPDGPIGLLAAGVSKDDPRLVKHQISQKLGPVSAGHLVDFFNCMIGQEILGIWSRRKVESSNYDPEPKTAGTGALAGKKFVITGTLSLPRDHFKALIEENGGTVSGSISKTTDYLVAGEKAGSKLAKAEKLGITVLSEGALADMIAGGGLVVSEV